MGPGTYEASISRGSATLYQVVDIPPAYFRQLALTLEPNVDRIKLFVRAR